MIEPVASWLTGEIFQPHGSSSAWAWAVPWMHVLADVLLAAAYFTISLVLWSIARQRKDLRLNGLIVWLCLFMSASGLLHVMSMWSLWRADDSLAGLVKLIAAAASAPAAMLLWRALPEVRALPSPRQLREVKERLARADGELEAFTTSVSHDLRSPLTTIAGQAGLLELALSKATDDQKRRLQRIQGSVREMSELIEALLALSRISRHTVHCESVDVTAVLESIVQDLHQRDPARCVEVRLQPHMSVHGDRRLIADLFQHLLDNAWKFTSKTPCAHIDIGQELHGPMSLLHVRDNGAGFDMAYRHKLFKPFQRLHGHAEFDGSGIGLATVARIVERHGGHIWAEGRPDGGAVFYFTLPATPVVEQRLAQNRSPA